MTKQKVPSSNMAATPLSFGSLGIGYKPPIKRFTKQCNNNKIKVERKSTGETTRLLNNGLPLLYTLTDEQ